MDHISIYEQYPSGAPYAVIPQKGNFNPSACHGNCDLNPDRILKPVHRVLLPDLLITRIRSRRHGHLSVDRSCSCALLRPHRIRHSDSHLQVRCRGRADRKLPFLPPAPYYRLSDCHGAFDSLYHFHLPLFRGNCGLFSKGGTDRTTFAHHFTLNSHGHRSFLHQWVFLWNQKNFHSVCLSVDGTGNPGWKCVSHLCIFSKTGHAAYDQLRRCRTGHRGSRVHDCLSHRRKDTF